MTYHERLNFLIALALADGCNLKQAWVIANMWLDRFEAKETPV